MSIRGEWMKCCGREILDLSDDFYIFDNMEFSDRHVTAGFCTNTKKCGQFVAQLLQYDKKKNKYDREKKTGKNAEKKLKFWKDNRYIEVFKTPKQGVKSNMDWLYQQNGNIYDFNGTLREKNYNRVDNPIKADFAQPKELAVAN